MLYLPTGAVWISETDTLKAKKTFYSKDWDAFAISWIYGIDIDDHETLTMARAIFSYRENKLLKKSNTVTKIVL